MSEDKTAQLVGIFKTLIRDNGMPQNIAEITDPEFLAFAEAHIDEFEEARDECETDRTLI